MAPSNGSSAAASKAVEANSPTSNRTGSQKEGSDSNQRQTPIGSRKSADRRSGSKSSQRTTGSLPPMLKPSADVEQILSELGTQWDSKRPKPLGFSNRGTNLCYRNSVVSMLLNLPSFSGWLKIFAGKQRVMAELGQSNSSNAPVLKALTELHDMYTSSSATEDQPDKLEGKMREFFKKFQGANKRFQAKDDAHTGVYRQQDADEFLQVLLTTMSCEAKRANTQMNMALEELTTYNLLERSYCTRGCQRAAKRHGSPEPGKIYRCHLMAGLEGKEKRTHETFLKCLNASLSNSYEKACPQCQQNTEHRSSMQFIKLPKLFLTTFSRNTTDQANVKIATDCPLPESFTPAVDDLVATNMAKEGKQPRYRLAGVVCHHGKDGASGHNITYVRRPFHKDTWYRIDDQKVKRVDFARINTFTPVLDTAQPLPYILAWELVNGDDDSIGISRDDKSTKKRGGDDVARDAKKHKGKKDSDKDTSKKTSPQKAKEKLTGDQKAAKEGQDGDLASRSRKVEEKEKEVDRKQKHLEEKQKKLEEKDKSVREDLNRYKSELDTRQTALDKQQELFRHLERPASPRVSSQLAQEAGRARNAAIFFATFRNPSNHQQHGEATFQLPGIDISAPLRIESTIQMTNPDGTSRPIKKGVPVRDHFFITFNSAPGAKAVRSVSKRKAGDDDDGEAGDASDAVAPPAAKKPRKAATSQKTGGGVAQTAKQKTKQKTKTVTFDVDDAESEQHEKEDTKIQQEDPEQWVRRGTRVRKQRVRM